MSERDRSRLDAQTLPSTVLDASGDGRAWHAHVLLFDCTDDVRAQRLRARNQPELVSERMNNWASYLREEARQMTLPSIDTSTLTVAEATDQLEGLLRRLAVRLPPVEPVR